MWAQWLLARPRWAQGHHSPRSRTAALRAQSPWPARCSLEHNLRAPPAPLQVPGGRPQHWQSRGWLSALCNEGVKSHTPRLLQRVPASPGLLFIPRHQWRLEPERVFHRHVLEMPFPSPAPLTLMRHSASKPVCGPLKGHRMAGEARATLTLSVLPLGAALGRGPLAWRGHWDPRAGCSRWHPAVPGLAASGMSSPGQLPCTPGPAELRTAPLASSASSSHSSSSSPAHSFPLYHTSAAPRSAGAQGALGSLLACCSSSGAAGPGLRSRSR